MDSGNGYDCRGLRDRFFHGSQVTASLASIVTGKQTDYVKPYHNMRM